ncbi:MAG TPA: hypothetical protein VFC39_16215 [Acidobacteriaceae bacterium]|nr:hypothetical protein [Acidobacteriaceae bacterium]
MPSQSIDGHESVQKDVTEWRRKELAKSIASAVRQMDRMDGLERPDAEYEKIEADLLARASFAAGGA